MYVVLMEYWFCLRGVLRALDNLKELWLIIYLGVGTLPHHLLRPHLVQSLDWIQHYHVTHSFDLDVRRILVHCVW
jgi:hypothetical protein